MVFMEKKVIDFRINVYHRSFFKTAKLPIANLIKNAGKAGADG